MWGTVCVVCIWGTVCVVCIWGSVCVVCICTITHYHTTHYTQASRGSAARKTERLQEMVGPGGPLSELMHLMVRGWLAVL